MKVEIKIDQTRKEPKVIIETDKITEEINAVVKKITSQKPFVLVGFKDSVAEILELDNVVRIYAEGGKTFAETKNEKYSVKIRLYEIEEKIDEQKFVRISNSEIINIKKAESFDLSLSGTVCVRMKNGVVTYVSRRNVKKIKNVLGM